jgi:uncharacterized membrane protein
MERASLFADSPVNRGRQIELDVVKGLAILFMLLVHCQETFSVYPIAPTWANRLIRFLGSPPGAPVFMFALGVGVAYTRKNTPRDLAKRGLQLLVLGYILNFARDTLTCWLVYLRTGDPADQADAVHYLFAVDILAFAGLTFLFFAGAAKLRLHSIHYLAAALMGGAVNLLLSEISFDSPAVYRITDLFWGTSEYTWFPFLTWIPFPIAGYLFGQLLVHCRDKQRLYQYCLWICLPALLGLALFARQYGIDFGWADGFWESPYFHHNILGNLVLVSFVLAWTSAFYFLTPRLPQFVVGALCRWSRNITEIYFIHWLIISFTWVLYPDPIPLPWILAYFLLLVPVTDWAAVKFLSLKSRLLARQPSGRAAA